MQQQAQALFKAWFVDLIPFDGSIPADWCYINFSNFLTPRTEKSSDPNLTLYSVTDTGIYPRNEKFKKNLSMTNTKNKVIHQDDLVFGMSREILNWGIMHGSLGGVSPAYNVYSVDEHIHIYYLESFIKTHLHYFKDLIKPASREGQGIDKDALMRKKLLLPSKKVLDDYYNIETSFTDMIASKVHENAILSALRDELLPRLMSGEIDVSNLNL